MTWTQSWRRKNKKGKIETAAKKKGKRSARVFKSIQGITIEDIKKRRDAKPDLKKAQRDNALREVKERAKKAKVEKKKVEAKSGKKAAAASAAGFEKVPKSRRLAAKPKATTR